MNKKILISLSTIGAIVMIAIGGTVAYFSNTETSQGNAFIAGAIDLKVDNECHYNGRACIEAGPGDVYCWSDDGVFCTLPMELCDCTWKTPIDLKGSALFSFLDVKPGDKGEDTISLHVDTNPAWICAEISDIAELENGCTEPEGEPEGSDASCDDPDGELWDNLYFNIWMDKDCDNVFDTDAETYLVQDAKATNQKYPIADSIVGGQPIQNACIGVEWYVPSNVGNVIQGDSVTGNITFKAYQGRHQDGFECFQTTLTVEKAVINDNGGLALPDDFKLTMNGSPVLSNDANKVTPGNYVVGETNLSGYTAGTWGWDCDANGNVSVAFGENKTCVITNDDVAPSLTLVKRVSGGDAQASDWTVYANGPTPISGAGGATSDSDFDAGTYTLSESTGPANYTAGSWACQGGQQNGNEITVALGETVACEITNTYNPPNGTLTVIKHVDNSNGGDAVASDFSITVTGNGPSPANFSGAEAPGTAVTLGAGDYSVSETLASSNYVSSMSTDCAGTMTGGGSKTCTITNTFQCFAQGDVMLVLDRSASIDTTERAQLKAAAHAFVTALNPDGGVHMGQSSFADNGSLDLHLTGSQAAINAAIDALGGGTYTNLYEGLDYANTELDDSNTTYERPAVPDYMIVITDGDPNRPTGTPDARTRAATEAAAARTAGVEIFVVGVGTTVDTTNYLINSIATNAAHYYGIADYEALEAALLNIAYCGNPPIGTLTVRKSVTNDNGGTKVISDFGLYANVIQLTSGVAANLMAGTYTITETNAGGYTATFGGDADCLDGVVDLVDEETINCTITNDDIARQTILSDGFGTGSTDGTFDEAPAWTEGGAGAEKRAPSGSGDNSTSTEGGRFAAMYGDNGRICRLIDTSAYNTVLMSYYWRGDADAEDGEYGGVYYRTSGSCSDYSGWTTVASHELDDGDTGDTLWVQNTGVSLPSSGTLFVRFRVYSSGASEEFRVDGVLVTGIPN